jgi:nucleotide-binding universal stress UspA family protein
VDLVVVGAHSSLRRRRVLFGSTTKSRCRRVSCPVLTVRK